MFQKQTDSRIVLFQISHKIFNTCCTCYNLLYKICHIFEYMRNQVKEDLSDRVILDTRSELSYVWPTECV